MTDEIRTPAEALEAAARVAFAAMIRGNSVKVAEEIRALAARVPARDDEALVEVVMNAMRSRDLFTHRTNKWRQDGKPFEVIRVFRNGDDPILIEPYAADEEADRAVWQCQLESDARAVLAALREAGALK